MSLIIIKVYNTPDAAIINATGMVIIANAKYFEDNWSPRQGIVLKVVRICPPLYSEQAAKMPRIMNPA
ncbi:hypothetical protein D3C73_1225590 [compost metagenome]